MVDLWSRSSGDDEAIGKGGTLAKVELRSRSSGDDEALVAGFARPRGCSMIFDV